MSTMIIIVWIAVGLLIAAGIASLTAGNVGLTWLGVLLMFLAIGGVVTYVYLAWQQTKKQFESE